MATTTNALLHKVTGVLHVAKSDLNLKVCLTGGQSFRWTQLDDSRERFVGVIDQRVYVLDQSDHSKIEYTAYSNDADQHAVKLQLNDYFRLGENLDQLYKEWSQKDAKFPPHTELRGIRVLRMDPCETLFSFICSSNNNIKRITQMVSALCVNFGTLLGSVESVNYYSFPNVERLSESKQVEEKLRELRFGYRARFIHQAAVYLNSEERPRESWLTSLRNESYDKTCQELIKIPGVGRKVADCVCLMSLDKLEAVPIDTHMLNLARTKYSFVPKTVDNMTDKLYKETADKFRQLWGRKAGWAHAVCFASQLSNKKNEQKDVTKSTKKRKLAN